MKTINNSSQQHGSLKGKLTLLVTVLLMVFTPSPTNAQGWQVEKDTTYEQEWGVNYDPWHFTIDQQNNIYFVYDSFYNAGVTTLAKMIVRKNTAGWGQVGQPLIIDWTTSGAFQIAGGKNNDIYFLDATMNRVSAGYFLGNQISVKKFNGTYWSFVGDSTIDTVSDITQAVLAVDDSDYPYIAYAPYDSTVFNTYNGLNRLQVKKFNGTNWVQLGTSIVDSAYYCDLAISHTRTPYVTYVTKSNGRMVPEVKRFDGQNWAALGSLAFLADSVYRGKIVIDPQDTPYFIYIKHIGVSLGGYDSSVVSVLKYDGNNWQYVGPSTGIFAYYHSANLSLVFDSYGTPYLSANATRVVKFDGQNWIDAVNNYQILADSSIALTDTFTMQMVIDSQDRLHALYQVKNEHPVFVRILSTGSMTNIISDTVWPGDANSDGVANLYDVLSLGLAYADTGGVRQNASNNWTGQLAPHWANSFNTGVNHNHADCDGNGTVDGNDTVPIVLNYGLTHQKAPLQRRLPGAAPLYLHITNAPVAAGDTARFDIVLGDTTIPANNVYGLAFSIDYDPALVDAASVKQRFLDSWLGQVSGSLLTLGHNDPSQNQLDLAVTRIDHNSRSGNGTIGELSVITIDNISGKDTVFGKLVFNITGAVALDANGDTVPVDARNDTLDIYHLTDGIQPTSSQQPNIRVYPNPTDGTVGITADADITGIRVLGITGNELMKREATGTRQATIDLSGLARGVYLLETTCGNQRTMKRVVLIN